MQKELGYLVMAEYSWKNDIGDFKVFLPRGNKCDELKDIFSLNPPAPNVSFYSQQRRGVWLGNEIAGQYKDKTVLIVGGGLAGTTCYFTMRALGHDKVWLVEARKELIGIQRRAAHRYAHPSLAEWPLAGSFSSATDLALMNWYAGPVNDVVERIGNDPAFKAAKNKWEDRIHYNCVVEELSAEYRGGVPKWFPQIRRYCQPNNHAGGSHGKIALPDDGFDVVVLATGFGRERGAGANNSEYWQFDFVGRIREDALKYGGCQRVVVGGGDGALIDAVRLCIGERAEELSLKLIFGLRHSQHQKFHTGVVSHLKSKSEIGLAGVYKPGATATFNGWFGKLDRDLLNTQELDTARSLAGTHAHTDVFLICEHDPATNPGQASPINVLMYGLLKTSQNGQLQIRWKKCKRKIKFGTHAVIKYLPGVAGRPQSIRFDSLGHTFVFRCGCEPDGLKINGGQFVFKPPAPGWTYGPTTDSKSVGAITHGILQDHPTYAGLPADAIHIRYRCGLVRDYVENVLGVNAQNLEFEYDQKRNPTVTIPVNFDDDIDKFRKLGGVDYTAFGIMLKYRDTAPPSPSFDFDDVHVNPGQVPDG